MTFPYDLLVRAPRLFCADSGLDGPGAVAIRGDRIVASGPGVEGPAPHRARLSRRLAAARPS